MYGVPLDWDKESNRAFELNSETKWSMKPLQSCSFSVWGFWLEGQASAKPLSSNFGFFLLTYLFIIISRYIYLNKETYNYLFSTKEIYIYM